MTESRELRTEERYIQARTVLGDYTVHFPQNSNIGIITAELLEKMGIKTICHEQYGCTFDMTDLCETTDIVVNANADHWFSNYNGITINTWDYRHVKFHDFVTFISDDLKLSHPLNSEYLLAIRAIADMLYSVTETLVF